MYFFVYLAKHEYLRTAERQFRLFFHLRTWTNHIIDVITLITQPLLFSELIHLLEFNYFCKPAIPTF